MHLLIPFAAWSAPDCQQRLPALHLPHLARILSRLQAGPRQIVQPQDPLAAHERALAQALGLASPAPWAALAAQRLGLAPGAQAWAFVTPCHWDIGQAQVTLHDPQQLKLQDEEALALLAAMQPYFAEDGLSLHFERADRWLVCGEPLRDVQGASLERMIGRNVAPWLPNSPLLRRLQNEIQMLLYTHPVNDARESRRQTTVNSFCLSGFGTLPASLPVVEPEPLQPLDLRGPVLQEDWGSWQAAWQRLDQTECRALLGALGEDKPARLTLCGENSWQSWASPVQTSRLRRLLTRWRQPDPSTILASLCK